MRSIFKFLLIGLGVLLIAVILLIVFAFSSSDIKLVSHVSQVDWLPSSASDITYARRDGFGWFLTYECNLPENDFLALAKKENWPVKETTNVLGSGYRLILKLPEPTNALGDPTYFADQAFVYENRYPNGGGVTVIYDRQRNRLLFNKSHN